MEFENLQIEVPTGENASQFMGVKVYEKKYHNKSKGFVVGFDPNTKEFIERKQRRAKRFGCKDNHITAPEQDTDKLSDIDRFKELDLKTLPWPPVPDEVSGEEIRTGAILLHGVDHMSTKDVFDYFKLFGPETIEWIDDSSCNVVWDDTASVSNALDGLSKTFGKLLELQRKANAADNPQDGPVAPPISLVVKDEDDDDEKDGVYENRILIEDQEAIDPRDIWRVGLPYNDNQLFLRFACTNDRKLPGAAQRSEYYLKYGRNENNENNVAGVLSNSRKRKLEQMKKLAVDRFKSNEPDVKIVDLPELKTEVSKMEVDEDEEPVVKRLNVDETCERVSDRITMTMVADKVEVQQRLGERNTTDTVHNRLGTPLPEDTGVHNRLGGMALDRIGQRNNTEEADARGDIHHTWRKHHNNQTYLSGGGYIDGSGDYHDVYLAEDVKGELDGEEEEEEEEDEDEDEKDFKHENDYDHDDRHTTDYHETEASQDSPTIRSNIRNRLGTPRAESPQPVSDLRDKLRGRRGEQSTQIVNKDSEVEARAPTTTAAESEGVVEESEIKDEEKVNLCIEIKQEPREGEQQDVPMENDEEEEFEF